MFGKLLWSVVLSAAAMMAASAVAQDEKNEIGGTLGRTIISDQGIKGATFFDPIIHSGKGLSFDIEYARRFILTPLFAISGEGVLMYNHDVGLNGGIDPFLVVPTQYSQLFVTPAARLNLFPMTAVSPWVSLGAGFGHFSESASLLYGGPNPGKSTTSGVVQGGFGLDVKVWRELRMRGEVRDFWSGEPDFPLAATGKTRQHNYFLAGGAVWHF